MYGGALVLFVWRAQWHCKYAKGIESVRTKKDKLTARRPHGLEKNMSRNLSSSRSEVYGDHVVSCSDVCIDGRGPVCW